MSTNKPARAVTIKDIAALLGMNHSTVSRALTGKAAVSDATRLRVREAADQLGYVANASARMIRGDAGPLIGLVIPDVRNDFYSGLSKALADLCRSQGLRMLLAITEDDPETECNEIRSLLEARVSGVLTTLTSKPLPATLDMLKDLPSVQIIRRIAKLKKTAVCMEDIKGCREATEHLLSLGHRNIAYVGTSKAISTGRDRVEGYLKAHEAMGVPPLVNGVELVPPREPYGYDCVSRVLKLHPTAIVIGSSELIIGGLKAIKEAGLNVPNDISIVGYGDPAWFDLLSPALTAVGLPVEKIADEAANQLFSEINHRGKHSESSAKVIRVMPHLVMRASTKILLEN